MKSIKIAGLCLVAVFAMSLAEASSALAGEKNGPHWEICTKVTNGKKAWNNKQCSTRGTGEEWETKQLLANETKAIEFTSSATTLRTENVEKKEISHEVRCPQDKGTGYIAGGWPGTNRETITFEKCTTVILGETCKARNKGGAGSNIVVVVNSELVYLSKAADETERGPLGILFKTKKNNETTFVELEFEGGTACSIANFTNTKVVANGAVGGPGIEGVAGVLCEAIETSPEYAVEHFLHCPEVPITEFWRNMAKVPTSGKAGLEFNNEKSWQIGQAQVELVSKEDFATQGT